MIQRLRRVLLGVAIGLGLCAGVVWVLIHSVGDREPMYQGKSIYCWQRQMDSPEAARSNETRLVLETQVIPRLTAVMFYDTNDSKLRPAIIEQLNNLPGVMIYFTPAEGRRAQAAAALGNLGSHGQAAIPDLLKALKGNDAAVRAAAAVALGEIKGQPDTVIPVLISCLEDPQEGVPEAAVEALGHFGALSRPALPKLLPLLQVRDKEMQRALTVALKQIDPEAAPKAGLK